MNSFSFHILSGNNYKDIEDASLLSQKMYLKYCSDENTKEGIEGILKYMSYDFMLDRRYKYDTLLIVSKQENKTVGILEMTKTDHISLLFVDDNFFKNHIATNMFNLMNILIKSKSYTVNSSKYAVHFYEKLGFKKISECEEYKDEIFLYPMLY